MAAQTTTLIANDSDDQHHAKCVVALKTLREPLATVWPPLTEAMYLLAGLPKAQEALWEMLHRGALQLLPLDSADTPRIRELIRKYANRPMDLADAALVRVAEREGLRKNFHRGPPGFFCLSSSRSLAPHAHPVICGSRVEMSGHDSAVRFLYRVPLQI
jgi:predicted nucleic acid-binding protein